MTATITAPRLAPVEPPYPADIEEGLQRWMGSRHTGIPPLQIFRTMYRNPRLAAALHPLGRYVLGEGLLPKDHREILILRTCARNGAEYEWGVHAAVYPARVGLSPAQVEATYRTPAGMAASEFGPEGNALLRAADELHDTSTLGEEAWAALALHWSEEQILEILLICGFYRFISYLARAVRIEFEPWQARFPV